MATTNTDPEEMMSYSFTVQLAGGVTKEVTAFRRDVGAPWTIKPRVGGKPRWMSLKIVGTSTADLALLRKRATVRIQQLVDGQFEPRKAKVPAVLQFATLGKLKEIYKERIRIETEIRKRTAVNNAGALHALVREARGVKDEQVDVLSSEILTASLVERWQDERMGKVQDADNLERGRERRSIDGKLNKARSLFTPAAMNVYRKAGLVLPELKGFLEVPMKGNWNPSGYVPIDEVTLERMNRTAWTELRAAEPLTFLTFLLMLRCGLRNSEVEHCRRCWIERSQAVIMADGKPQMAEVAFLAVIARPGWEGAKNRKDHRIPLAPDVLAEIETLGGEDYLLGPQPSVRFDISHRSVSDFVRRFLPDLAEDPEKGRTKAAYELRKHFGAVVASTQSLDRAAEYLGDRRDTVEKFYHAWLQNRTARPMLASELTPNVLAAVA